MKITNNKLRQVSVEYPIHFSGKDLGYIEIVEWENGEGYSIKVMDDCGQIEERFDLGENDYKALQAGMAKMTMFEEE